MSVVHFLLEVKYTKMSGSTCASHTIAQRRRNSKAATRAGTLQAKSAKGASVKSSTIGSVSASL
jgi:hypothetical protein